MKNSVIIPVYNVEKYLEQCVSSVLQQPESEDIEVILVDDGSTDGSGELCDALAEKDSRIVCVHQKNEGQSSARNKGLDIATGEYVFFLDSDDFWNKNIYPDIYKELRNNHPDVLIFSMVSFFSDAKKGMFFDCILKDDMLDEEKKCTLKEYLKRDYSFGWCPVWYGIKKTLLESKKLTFPVGFLCEDVSFTFRLWMAAKSVACLDKVVYNYRRDNSESTTHIASYKFSVDLLKMIKSNLEIAKEQISDPEMLGLLKLNFQTLVEVVLYWFTSYSTEEQRNLLKEISELKEIYNVEPEARKYMKKKEKLVNVLLSSIGVTCTAKLWGLKRKKHIK